MSFLLVIVALLVIGVVALVVAGRLDAGTAYLPDAQLDLRPAGATGNDFDVVVRGYRMDEVDARIAELQAQVDALASPSADLPPESRA